MIGLNFVRAFLNPENPSSLLEHATYGLELGAEDAISYGADYFFTKSNPDKSRIPFYFAEQENASCYPQINQLFEENFSEEIVEKISHQNVINFLERLWK